MVENEFYHHGIKGQKWGVRRYQNEDGTLTAAGKKHEAAAEETFTASNGQKVAKAKNLYSKVMRKVAMNENLDHLRATDKNTKENIRNERNAIREYDAHQKDVRRGTGDKYLQKAVRQTKISDTRKQIDDSQSIVSKLLYNKAVFDTAAKKAVDKNMDVKTAVKNAKREAWIITGAAVALSIAMNSTKR